MSSDLLDTIQRAREALPEAVQFAFNLPGPPYVLLCAKIARKGIDLHLWCRRVVQYDLEWNPALMEQQIGRLIVSAASLAAHRALSMWFGHGCRGRIRSNSRVREPMEMMKVLLGAREWLAVSPKEQGTADLGQFQLDFAP